MSKEADDHKLPELTASKPRDSTTVSGSMFTNIDPLTFVESQGLSCKPNRVIYGRLLPKIWQRYLFRELVRVFALFLFCFYFLYVLIDYSVHAKDFQNSALSFVHIAAYYGCQFTKRADILFPVALLIATIKVLTTSNLRGEIVALATGGISLKKIMGPLLMAAAFCSFFLYLNFQFLQPFSLNQISLFEEKFFKTQTYGKEAKPVHALILEDNSLLIYQSYDQNKESFMDTYWLIDSDHLFKIQSLFPFEKIPYGIHVDYLVRSSEGELLKSASYATCPFPQMRFDPKTLFSAAHPPRMQSITQLAHTMGWKQMGLGKMNDRAAESATFFYFKLISPLICFLAVMGPAPFCLRFSRNLPVYFIYALSLFGMIAFYTLVNSSIVLGESQVFAPILAILLPQTLFFLVLGLRYAKL